jgi:hypothetical protein
MFLYDPILALDLARARVREREDEAAADRVARDLRAGQPSGVRRAFAVAGAALIELGSRLGGDALTLDKRTSRSAP